MSAGRKIWGLVWRTAVCLLLLAWIFQTIFWNEGKTAWLRDGDQPAWNELSRVQRLEVSWTHGPRELWRNLTLIPTQPLALSFALMGATILLGMLRWRAVMKAHNIQLPVARAAEISLVAHFFNAFLLGSTGGDLTKAYYAARETHHKKTEAVATVIVDRLIGLFSMLLFAALMMIPNRPMLFSHSKSAAASWFVLAMLGGCGLVLFIAFWGGVSRGIPGARGWLRRLPKGESIERMLDACRTFGKHPWLLLQSLGLSMLLNAACVLQFVVLARGLDLRLDPLPLFAIVPIIISISALPITPSGLGVRENLFVIMLGVPATHIAPTPALSLSLLAYAGSLFWSLVGGLVYLTLKERRHLREITTADARQN